MTNGGVHCLSQSWRALACLKKNIILLLYVALKLENNLLQTLPLQ